MRIHTDTETPAHLAHLLEAVAEPTRLRILNLLQNGEFCVCDLQTILGLSEPLVSRHLARLRFAHLVTADRDGARMVYHLTPADSVTTNLLQRFLLEVSKEEPALQRDRENLRTLLRGATPPRSARKTLSCLPRTKEVAQ